VGVIDAGCGKTLIGAQIGMWVEITDFIQICDIEILL